MSSLVLPLFTPGVVAYELIRDCPSTDLYTLFGRQCLRCDPCCLLICTMTEQIARIECCLKPDSTPESPARQPRNVGNFRPSLRRRPARVLRLVGDKTTFRPLLKRCRRTAGRLVHRWSAPNPPKGWDSGHADGLPGPMRSATSEPDHPKTLRLAQRRPARGRLGACERWPCIIPFAGPIRARHPTASSSNPTPTISSDASTFRFEALYTLANCRRQA